MRSPSTRRSFLTTSGLALAVRSVWSQDPHLGDAQKDQKDAPVFSSDVKVVNVLATVRTKGGDIVADLTKDVHPTEAKS